MCLIEQTRGLFILERTCVFLGLWITSPKPPNRNSGLLWFPKFLHHQWPIPKDTKPVLNHWRKSISQSIIELFLGNSWSQPIPSRPLQKPLLFKHQKFLLWNYDCTVLVWFSFSYSFCLKWPFPFVYSSLKALLLICSVSLKEEKIEQTDNWVNNWNNNSMYKLVPNSFG